MTHIKSKTIKEVITNIKQEQRELNNLQRLENWEQRFINQTELLHKVEKDLEDKTFEVNFAKEQEKSSKEYYQDLWLKERNKAEALNKTLTEKNENTQISLLKEQYEKEIRKLKHDIEIVNKNYHYLSVSNLKDIAKLEELEKELEEKELLVEYLEDEIEVMEEGNESHLDALELAKKWNDLQKGLLRDEIAKKKQKAHDRKILLRKIESENQQLKSELYLNTKPLPKTPSKFKVLKERVKTKFQQLIKKQNRQEQKVAMVARVEVKTK